MNIDKMKIRELLNDFEQVKPRLIERLASKVVRENKANDRILTPIKHTNLMMEYAIDVSEYNADRDVEENTYIVVTQSMLDLWSVDITDIKVLSEINTPRRLPSNIQLLSSILGVQSDDAVPMVVVSNETITRGAGAIFYKSTVSKVRELLSSDFYILPSSTHEMLCVPKTMGTDVYSLLDMVREVNDSDMVSEEDILDYDVYEFVNGFLHSVLKY